MIAEFAMFWRMLTSDDAVRKEDGNHFGNNKKNVSDVNDKKNSKILDEPFTTSKSFEVEFW